MTSPEVFASVGINSILHKVTEIEKHMAVMSCDLGALRKTTTEEIEDLDTRMRVVEAERFPWVKIGSMVAVAALITTLVFGVIALNNTGGNPPPPPPRPPGPTGP